MQSFAKGLSRKRIRRQSGSVATLGALWLMVAVICLATIDIGNVFWQKRELQKIADLAALAGASGMLDSGSCRKNAEVSAQSNGGISSEVVQAAAGRWEAGAATSSEEMFKEGVNPVNACKVLVRRLVPYLFFLSSGDLDGRNIEAKAIAYQTPRIAKVTVKSTLLSLDTEKSKLLDAVIGGLLGGKIKLDVVGWRGIADANIELLKFLDALAIRAGVNAGNYDQLVAAKIPLGKFMLAMADVLPRNGDLAAVNALEALSVGVGNISVALFDVLKLGTGLGTDALKTNVNVLDLVTALAQVANGKNAIGVGVNIDLYLATVALNLKVIEHPQNAIGDPAKEKIIAKTAQIDLSTDVGINIIEVAKVKLNLNIKLAQGIAEINSYVCENNKKSLNINGVTGVGTVDLSLVVETIILPPFPLVIKVPVSIPLRSKPQLLSYDPAPRLDESPIWKTIYQSNLVESLIAALTDKLGILGWILGVILSPIAAILDAIVNTLLSVLGIGLAQTDIAGQLNCNNRVDLVY